MFSIFGQYSTKGSIVLDASLVRSFKNIRKSLIQPKTYEEIMTLMEEQDEKVSLTNPWSIMSCFIKWFKLLNCFIYFIMLL